MRSVGLRSCKNCTERPIQLPLPTRITLLPSNSSEINRLNSKKKEFKPNGTAGAAVTKILIRNSQREDKEDV